MENFVCSIMYWEKLQNEHGGLPTNPNPTWKNQWWNSMAIVIALALDVSGSEQSCCKVCLSSNHPLKLAPTQIKMFSAMFEAFQTSGRPWDRSQHGKLEG